MLEEKQNSLSVCFTVILVYIFGGLRSSENVSISSTHFKWYLEQDSSPLAVQVKINLVLNLKNEMVFINLWHVSHSSQYNGINFFPLKSNYTRNYWDAINIIWLCISMLLLVRTEHWGDRSDWKLPVYADQRSMMEV